MGEIFMSGSTRGEWVVLEFSASLIRLLCPLRACTERGHEFDSNYGIRAQSTPSCRFSSTDERTGL
jgi:hypothetical protein